MKIITLTINPAVDKSARVDGLSPEQKLRCHSLKYQAGGGGINISRVLKRLNVDTSCIFTSGGSNGEFIQQELEKSAIHAIPVFLKSWTRENLSVVDTKTNLQYRFGMPGPKILEDEIKLLNKTIHEIISFGDILAISGSLGEGIPFNFYAELIRGLATKEIKVILDTSGDALVASLKEKVYLIKPNQKELAQLAGKEWLNADEQEGFCKELVQSEQVKFIVVSLGGRGAFIVSKDGINYLTPPPVKVMSTIGAGDSMLAGIIYGLTKNETQQNILKWGVACGTATTMEEGTDLAQVENIDAVIKFLDKQK